MSEQRPEQGTAPGAAPAGARSGGGRAGSGGRGGSERTRPMTAPEADSPTQALPLVDADGPGPSGSRASGSRPSGGSRSLAGPRQGQSATTVPERPARGAAAEAGAAREGGAGERSRSGGARAPRPTATAAAGASAARSRRARLRLRRVDPWSVFVLALLLSLFLAVVLVVAVVALYAVLTAAGVPDTINQLVAEVTRASGPDAAEPEPLLTAGRAVTAAGIIAAVDVLLLTGLATLAALLYNVCASFTGGLVLTLAEPDER